jgi:para-aminobenzoate synthetase component 1
VSASPEFPLVEPLGKAPDAAALFGHFCRRPHGLFLDSALRHPQLGRYSFLAADPFEFYSVPVDGPDALAMLADRLAALPAERVAGLPPFQGGAAGLLAYDLGRQLERLPDPAADPFGVPALAVGLYDVVVAIDHVAEEAWIISQGFPETDAGPRRRRAKQRAAEVRSWLAASEGDPPGLRAASTDDRESLDAAALEPQFACEEVPGLFSNFSKQGYLEMAARGIEHVHSGDVFQVNLAQRLLMAARDDSVTLYLRLRERNPAPFAGYFDLGPFQIVSASPERFLRSVEGRVEARPIKGTRRRTRRPEADLFAGDALRASEKDRAENVMIVDLLRNDLSRVCRPDSVRVEKLCQLESYEYVQHLVSVVAGRLDEGSGPIDLVRAAFPGGSITGAPKIRAMEIISQLERVARGPYCGSLGYIGFDGNMDLSILIRTITAGRGWWQAPVGGGIVAQSIPLREYQETWHKAEGLLRAMVRP